MTGEQWLNVPDSVIRDGTRFIAWLEDRGIRPPTLAELEAERARRGVVGKFYAARQGGANREEETA